MAINPLSSTLLSTNDIGLDRAFVPVDIQRANVGSPNTSAKGTVTVLAGSLDANGVYTAGPISVALTGTSPLPTGAATAANQVGTGTAAQTVQGNVADGAADTGNSVKIGAVVTSSSSLFTPSKTVGNRTQLATNTSGVLATFTIASSGATPDGNVATLVNQSLSANGSAAYPATANLVFNNTTWDRARGDTTGTWSKQPPLAATSRSLTATTTSQQLMAANTLRSKFVIKNDSTIVVWINIGATAVAAAGSGNISIAASGGYLEMNGTNQAINIIAASTTAAITALEF